MTAIAAWLFGKRLREEQERVAQALIPMAMHPVMDTNGLCVTMSHAGPFRRWEGNCGERFVQTGPGESMSRADQEWLNGDKNISHRKLVTLEEFNSEQATKYSGEINLAPNGISCPQCPTTVELVDSNPNVTLTTNPPRKHIHCPQCGWRGMRIA